jgi:hypothetical protein
MGLAAGLLLALYNSRPNVTRNSTSRLSFSWDEEQLERAGPLVVARKPGAG